MKTTKLSSLCAATFSIILLTAFNSCSDNSTDDTKNTANNFLFKVTVKNSSGVPVQGLRLSAYNDPTTIGLPKKYKTTKINSISTVQFALPQLCLTTLTLCELDGTVLQQPITNSPLQAGAYSVSLSLNKRSAGTRVYKTVLTAKIDTSNLVLFRDSIYIVLWQPDASASVLGHTSGTGIFETTDSLAFPNILNLPPIVRTTEKDPTPVGTVSFTADVVITLYDSTTQKTQIFTRKVNKGMNEFELIWNPSGDRFAVQQFSNDKFTVVKPDTGIRGTIPTEFHLYQNYPNPFN